MDPKFILLCIFGALVIVAVVVGVRLAMRMRMEALREDEGPVDELAEFRRMLAEGQITEEEFERLRRTIAMRIVEQVKRDQDNR